MSDAALAALAQRAGDAADDSTPETPNSRAIKALAERAAGKNFPATKQAAPEEPKDIGNVFTSITEPAVKAASSFVGMVPAGLAGLGTAAARTLGLTQQEPGDVVGRVQNALTIEPSTRSGEAVSNVLSYPLQKIGQGIDYLGEKAADITGSPAVGAAVNTALNVAPALLGKLRGKPEIKPSAEPGAATAEAAPASAAPASPKFEEAPAVAKNGIFSAAEQAKRAEVLNKIGLDEARQSALTGDAKAASTEFQTSKLDNAAGTHLRNVIDKERQALSNYSEQLVRDSGGSVGTDQSSVYARGSSIIEPLDALKESFDSKIESLYKIAHERAGDVPISTPETHKLAFGDTSEFLGTVEGEALLRGVTARMKALKMVDEHGNPLPATVKEAERFKQYLNNQWTPRTSRLIRQLKDSIDDDVTKAAGMDIYQEARSTRELRSKILDDPKGISKLMDAEGPEGINRAVATEKIPDAITGLPVEQFNHIIKTLREVPEDLQPKAQSALNEIRAHFANRVMEAGNKQQGQWNAKGVTQYLKANSARMSQVYTPEEMANFQALNDAGHILKKDQSYPGAAIQEHNLVKAGAMAGIRGAGAAAGAGLGGPIGAAVGDYVANRAATKFSEASALKEAQKRTVKLNELMKKGPPE